MLKSDKKPGGLAEHAAALVQMRHAADMDIAARERIADAPRPPSSNTGATLRHSPISPDFSGEIGEGGKVSSVATAAQSNPPPPEKAKRTRAVKTSEEMQDFLGLWFFDWLSVTVPNTVDGKGQRRGTDPSKRLLAAAQNKDPEKRKAALEAIRWERELGEVEEKQAQDRLCLWAVTHGMAVTKVGKAPDGYEGGLLYGASPVDTDVMAMVRGGHKINMPALVLPGADGACASLAPKALKLLGPLLVSRVDVSWDHSQEGFFDALWKYAVDASVGGKKAPPVLTDEGKGRTFKWGNIKNGAMVRVYEKDRERVAKGKLAEADCDLNLVRVEFSFAPKSTKKAGIAKVAREGGAGAVLGTVLWVRRMAEHIAEITGQARADQARMGVSRVERMHVKKTAMERAAHGIAQYGRAICEAAAAEIVGEEYDGDWHAAEITPDEVRARAVHLVAVMMDASTAPEHVVMRTGLDQVRSREQEAARNADDLRYWIERQRSMAEVAQAALMEAAERAAEMMGVPMGHPVAAAA